MAKFPKLNREFVNNSLKSNGYSEPDNMSEHERFDAVLRICLSAGKPSRKIKMDEPAKKKSGL